MIERINNVIKHQLAVKEHEIQPNTSFIEDLGADSLDAIELTMAIEEEFNIEIPDADAEKIDTVQQLYNYVEGRCK